jgi:hypothetical protein
MEHEFEINEYEEALHRFTIDGEINRRYRRFNALSASHSQACARMHSQCSVWGQTEAMRLHYKISEGKESVQYCGVMSSYPYICKYFKFPIDTLLFMSVTHVVIRKRV